jgi:hypothetical protein
MTRGASFATTTAAAFGGSLSRSTVCWSTAETSIGVPGNTLSPCRAANCAASGPIDTTRSRRWPAKVERMYSRIGPSWGAWLERAGCSDTSKKLILRGDWWLSSFWKMSAIWAYGANSRS